MALKPKRSSFDAWGGGGSAFDTSTMWVNRPIPPPLVVEDVLPRLRGPVGEAQTQPARRSRGRLFGLKLKLPWFGPKDSEKQRGSVVSAGKKLHHQMTCNSDERGMAWQQAKTQEHLVQQDRPGSSKEDIGTSLPQPLSRLHTLPVYMDSAQPEDIPEAYARNAQSLDLQPGEVRRAAWHQGTVHSLGRVEEGSTRIGANRTGAKSKWTQRASQSVVRMASRFGKTRERSRPALERASAGLPSGPKVNHQAELERRKSIGAFAGNLTVSCEAPIPEDDSRCPPDNLFIPSGPPDGVSVRPGAANRSLSIGASMRVTMTPGGDAHLLQSRRWSMDLGFSRPAAVPLWDRAECESRSFNNEGSMQCTVPGLQTSVPGARAEVVHLLPYCQHIDATVEYPSRRRGFEDTREVRVPVGQNPKPQVGPAGWVYDAQEDRCNEPKDVDCPTGQSRPRRVRRDSMAKNIFGDAFAGDAKLELVDGVQHAQVLGPSPVPQPGLLGLIPKSHRSGVSSEGRSSEPEVRRGAGVATSATSSVPDDPSFQQDSFDCWSQQHQSSGFGAAAGTSQQDNRGGTIGQGYTRSALRPSLSLSEPHCTAPVSWCDENKIGQARALTPSDRSLQVPSHIELAASCTSDGPMYHRSLFFEAGFSSGEDSDDDLDGAQRFTPSQFTLKWKRPQHRRRHSDGLRGLSIFHHYDDDDDDDEYRSHSRYRLDRSHRLEYSMSDYSRSFEDYPEEPGFSLRTGTDSDMILPDFEDIEEHTYSRHRRSLDGGKKPRKSWLDELQEGAELRRKECTYRIACQRAIMQSMKETVQASKLAFERLKSGLCPRLTSRVPQLRRRWGGARRAKRREQAVRAAKYDEEVLWAEVPLAVA